MSLETVLKILEFSINDNLANVDESLLEDGDVQEVLTTYFSEEEARPDLTGLIKVPSLMFDYLQLDVKEREELDSFNRYHPDFLNGKDTEIQFQPFKSSPSKKLAKNVRRVNLLLKLFDFYIENRENGEIFNSKYLLFNERLQESFGNSGKKLYKSSMSDPQLEDGFMSVVRLASGLRPSLENYCTNKGIFKLEAPTKLIQVFNFYLDNREEGEIFEPSYFKRNDRLKTKFGNLAGRIYEKSRYMLSDEGGYNTIVDLACAERPDMKHYLTFKDLLEVDGPKQLIRIFDFFLENRENTEAFNVIYLHKNKKMNGALDNVGMRLYANARNNLEKEGRINYLVELASRERPEILACWGLTR